MHRDRVLKWPDGTIAWYNTNGELHCDDGPAILFPSGNKYWYLNGTELSFDEWCYHLDIGEKTRTFLRIKYGS